VLDVFLGATRGESESSRGVDFEALGREFRNTLTSTLNSIRRSGQHGIQYHYDIDTLKQATLLYRNISKAVHILPSTWSFRGINAQAFNEVWSALTARCAIHALAHIQAGHSGHNAAGAGTVVLLTSHDELTSEISAVTAGVSKNLVSELIKLLTYNLELPINKRDPALQPLIPLSGNRLGIAPHLVLSSNGERNLVALLARHYKEEYDKTTNVLEVAQLSQLENELATAGFNATTDKKVPGRKDLPNIDLALADASTGTMLLIEAKWVIEPSETSEVIERTATQKKAVSQIAKLIAFAHDHPEQLWRTCFPTLPPPKEIQVTGCVVIRGFAGVAPLAPADPPVIPEQVLRETAKHVSTLKDLIEWIQSRKYLPVEGVHFRQIEETVKFDELSVIWGGFNTLSPPKLYP
jgi:hypothetical protein